MHSQGHTEMAGTPGSHPTSDESPEWRVGNFLGLFICCDNSVLNMCDRFLLPPVCGSVQVGCLVAAFLIINTMRSDFKVDLV